MRWFDPEKGLISPASFIPLAEETSLILPLGEFVLRKACQEAIKWHAAGFTEMTVAVNLSPKQFQLPNLHERIAQILVETGMPRGKLHLEITESQIKGTKVQKNLGISRALFNIIFETIHEGFGERSAISWEEIARIEKKLEESWPHVESLFDNTCAQCMDTRWYVRDERRKDFLTRLVFAKIVMGVPDRKVAGGLNFPRVMVSGLQTVIAVVLTNREWRILNDHVRFIFEYIGSDDDVTIVTQLKRNPAIQLLCQRVFLTLLLRFKGFNSRRQEFIRIVNNAVADSNYRMNDAEFCEIFEVLFREYHDMVGSEDGRLRLAISHSEDFPDKIKGIFDAYTRFKNGLQIIQRIPVSPSVK